MVIDWNFVLSIITTIVAVIALIISVAQIKISNRQNMFDKRLNNYMVIKGLINLYEQNRERLEANKKDEPIFAIDLEFCWLTNNNFLEEIQSAISEPLTQPYHKEYLKKQEEIKRIAQEVLLVFSGKEAQILSEFVLSYTDLLHKMYQYQILLKHMKEDNEKKPTMLNVLQERYHEKSFRDELLLGYKKLKEYYDKLVEEKVETKILKQMRLC